MKKLLFIASLFVFQSILFSVEASRPSDEEVPPITSPRSSQPTGEASGSSDEEDASLSAPRGNQQTAAEDEYVELEQAGYFNIDLDDPEIFLDYRRMAGKRILSECNLLKAWRSTVKVDTTCASARDSGEELITISGQIKDIIRRLQDLNKDNMALIEASTQNYAGNKNTLKAGASTIDSQVCALLEEAHAVIQKKDTLARKANTREVHHLREELLRNQEGHISALVEMRKLQAEIERLQRQCQELRGVPFSEGSNSRASAVVVEDDDGQARDLPLAAFGAVRAPTVEEPMTVRDFIGSEARVHVPPLQLSRAVLLCQPEVTDAREHLPSSSQALRHSRPFVLEDIYTERVARNLGLLGAEYIQPDSPIAMEMFFNFTEAKTRAELSSLLSGGRRLGGDSLDRVIRLELMLNERILLTLNGIDAAFSREDKINSIFRKTEGKGPEETAALSCILKGYRAFFFLRVDFLGKVLDPHMTPRSLPKFEFLDGSSDKNNKLGKMIKYIENLFSLLNDVRDEFFEIKVPLDILSAQESIVVNFSKEHRRLMNLVGCPMNGSADLLKGANYADPLRLELNFTRQVSSNIKGYMDPKTYLTELANALRRQTSLQTASSILRFLDGQ